MDNANTVEPAPTAKKRGRPKKVVEPVVEEVEVEAKVPASDISAEMAEIQRIALNRQNEQRKMAPESLVTASYKCPRKALIKRYTDAGLIPDDMVPVFQLPDNLRQKAHEGFNPILDPDRPGEFATEPGGDVMTLIPKKVWDAKKFGAAKRSRDRVKGVDQKAAKLGIENSTVVGEFARDDVNPVETD